MRQHEAGSRSGEDIESVHQMRVAIRRMRSLFRLIPGYYQAGAVAEIETGLRDSARALGRIRDLDVLILDLEEHSNSLPPDQQAHLQLLVDRLDRRRAKRRKRLIAHFNSKRHARFQRRLTAFGETKGDGVRRVKPRSSPHQARHVLPPLLHQRMAQVKAYDVLLPSSDIHDLHALRVEFKQLRYAVEFFQPLLGASAGRFLALVKIMQDSLGRIQDISVFAQEVGALKKLSPEQNALLDRYRAQRLAEQNTLREQFAQLWTRFNSRATLRLFSDSLLVLR